MLRISAATDRGKGIEIGVTRGARAGKLDNGALAIESVANYGGMTLYIRIPSDPIKDKESAD